MYQVQILGSNIFWLEASFDFNMCRDPTVGPAPISYFVWQKGYFHPFPLIEVTLSPLILISTVGILQWDLDWGSTVGILQWGSRLGIYSGDFTVGI